MKRVLLNLVMVLALLMFSSMHSQVLCQTLDALDMQYGLFGVSFETSLDSLPGLQKNGFYQKKAKYVDPDLPRVLGPAALSAVNFLFYKNRLHSIMIKTENEENSQKLLEFIQLFYGTGQKDGFSNLYSWEGKKVSMIYEQNILTKSAVLLITSLSMDAEFRKEWRIDY